MGPPHWRHPAFHSVDFAVELRTAAGPIFTVSWESPGEIEGLGLREGPAVGMAISDDALAAVWDVSPTAPWQRVIGGRVNSVQLLYQPWDGRGPLWCRRIEMNVHDHTVIFLLAEGSSDSDSLVPSANNIAVRFDHSSEIAGSGRTAPICSSA